MHILREKKDIGSTDKAIAELITGNSLIIQYLKAILNEQKLFYKQLFKGPNTGMTVTYV